jgi:hypothetical protein
MKVALKMEKELAKQAMILLTISFFTTFVTIYFTIVIFLVHFDPF